MKDIGEIVVYGAPWCGDCLRSEALIDSLNILYKKVDIDKQREVEQYIKEKQNGLRKIPHIVFEDESFLVEPSDEELMNKIFCFTKSFENNLFKMFKGQVFCFKELY